MSAIERPESVRQSFLAKYDSCPHSAYLYLKHDGGTESHYKTRGTAFHLFMQRATEEMLEQGEPTMPGDVGRQMADEIMAEHPEWVISAKEQDAVRLMAWNWCEATVLDLNALIGVEVPLKIELGGYTITGTLDRIEVHGQSLHIHDAKTSLHVPTREEAQKAFQGMLYALLAVEGFHERTGLGLGHGINDVWFWLEYPRYRTDEGPLVMRDASWERPEIHEFKTSLLRNLDAMSESFESGEWPARDGSWCDLCPAPSECPIPAHLRQVEHIGSLADAEDAFSQTMALEREMRRYRDGLRAWVKEHGPIYRGDYAYDARVSTSREVKDWDGLHEGIRRSVEFGVPFVMDDHIRPKTSTKYAKRRLTKEEQE